MIDDVFAELDRTARPGVDCEGGLAEVGGVDNLVGMWAHTLQCSLSRTGEDQPAFFGRVAQHNATVFRITGSLVEHPPRKGSRLSRIRSVDVGTRSIRGHLRR